MENTNQARTDVIRLIICVLVIIIGAIFVWFGKADFSVFIQILTGIVSYYLGKTSSQS